MTIALVAALFSTFASSGAAAAEAPRPFESWIERRDRGVVRQAHDYSCGLAALATILNAAGAPPVTERELLDELLAEAGMAGSERVRRRGVSFADLARLAAGHGRQLRGVDVHVDDLPRLRVPAIVALSVGGRSHFAVLHAVNREGAALLADPSWGNRRVAAWEFRRLFERAPGSGRGRLLLDPRWRSHSARSPRADWIEPVHIAPPMLRPRRR